MIINNEFFRQDLTDITFSSIGVNKRDNTSREHGLSILLCKQSPSMVRLYGNKSVSDQSRFRLLYAEVFWFL